MSKSLCKYLLPNSHRGLRYATYVGSLGKSLPILAVVMVAAMLRLYRIDHRSVWIDEAFTMWLSSKDLGTIWRLNSNDVHPPLQYYLYHCWLSLGSNEFVIRFPAALLGIASVPVLWRTTRSLLGPQPAIMASLLLAISPMHIWASQVARNYTLATFWGLLSVFFLARLWKDGAVLSWGGYVATTALAMYSSSVLLLFLLPSHAVALALNWRRAKAAALATTTGMVSSLVLYTPWLLALPTQAAAHSASLHDSILSFPWLFNRLELAAWLISDFNLGPLSWHYFYGSHVLGLRMLVYASLLLFGLLMLCGARASARDRCTTLFTSHLVLTLGLGFGASVATAYYFFRSRQFLVVVPFYFLLTAIGVQSIRRAVLRRLSFVCCLAASGAGLCHLYFGSPLGSYAQCDEDWRSAARYVSENERPGDTILMYGHVRLPFNYYYHGQSGEVVFMRASAPEDPSSAIGSPDDRWKNATVIDVSSGELPLPESFWGQLDEASKGGDRLWFLSYSPAASRAELDGVVRDALANRVSPLVQEEFAGLTVYLYDMNQPLPATR